MFEFSMNIIALFYNVKQDLFFKSDGFYGMIRIEMYEKLMKVRQRYV